MTYPETITGCCRELLDASSEPLSIAQLVEQAVALGRTKARYPEAAVDSTIRRSPHILALDGGRFLSVRRLMEGRVLTTAVPANSVVGMARQFDLAPFDALPDADEPELPENANGLLLSHRYRDGQVVAEIVGGGDLTDGTPLVEAVQGLLGPSSRYGFDLCSEVLQACAADDALLREPIAPLSELFPDLAPQPPVSAQRLCSACNGTGSVPDWDPGWEPDWTPEPEPSWPKGAFGSSDDPPYGWHNRLERLEEAVFGYR
jgi:hypothetical protein